MSEVDLTLHPIRAHQISMFRKCAEMSRLNVAIGIHPPWVPSAGGDDPVAEGTRLHDWLDMRPRSGLELALKRDLEAVASKNDWWDNSDLSKGPKASPYFIRMFKGCTIKVHPDDIRVYTENGKRVAQIVEYKGTMSVGSADNIYTKVQYEWQLRTYIYVMRPFLTALGLELAQFHPIEYYSRKDAKYLTKTDVFAIADSDYEIQLDYVFSVWKGIIQPKPPKWFKCRDCPVAFKSACNIRKQWLADTLQVEDAEKREWREPLHEPQWGAPKGSEPLEWDDLWEIIQQ